MHVDVLQAIRERTLGTLGKRLEVNLKEPRGLKVEDQIVLADDRTAKTELLRRIGLLFVTPIGVIPTDGTGTRGRRRGCVQAADCRAGDPHPVLFIRSRLRAANGESGLGESGSLFVFPTGNQVDPDVTKGSAKVKLFSKAFGSHPKSIKRCCTSHNSLSRKKFW